MSKASKELIEKRAALMKQFNEFRQKKQTEWAEQRARRLELRNRKCSMMNLSVFNFTAIINNILVIISRCGY